MDDKTITDNQEVPQEIDRWNWTASAFGPFWVIRNNLPRDKVLISLIPFIGSLMVASSGNKWVWQLGEWESIEQFKKAQKEQFSDLLTYYWIVIGAPVLFMFNLFLIVFLIMRFS
jgi:hypothetical protein